jgi:hypothetical protein
LQQHLALQLVMELALVALVALAITQHQDHHNRERLAVIQQ